MTTFDYSGKVALVAGGQGGLGSPIADELTSRGMTVVTASRSTSQSPNHVVADFRSPDDANRVINDIVAQHGRLDVVVNAVGVVAFGNIDSLTSDTVEELFLTNTFAHIFLCQEAIQKIQEGGVIVGISGVIAEQNLPGLATYGASKAAVKSFNEAFAREARRAKVRVIDARPPHTETGLSSRAIAGTAPQFPIGLSPETVALRIVQAITDGETDLAATAFGGA
jgi:cyclic-di-GMP-binding biofilm dispersal mediator protein